VDTERRLDHMQQHTAQHLLSALLADEYGWATVSVHFGDLASTVDVACAEGIGAAQLARIEQRVNALLRAQHAVQVNYEEAATATGLRKASDRDGTLRIITIAGLDRSACGGTHLANTAEIGAILLRGAERTRGHTRIEFLAGDRVLRRAHGDAALLTRAARPLSAAPGDLPALVEQQVARLAELERDRKRLLAELAGHEAEALWQNSAVDAHGVRRVRHRVAGGRGGGSPRLAQGALPDAAALPALATALGF